MTCIKHEKKEETEVSVENLQTLSSGVLRKLVEIFVWKLAISISHSTELASAELKNKRNDFILFVGIIKNSLGNCVGKVKEQKKRSRI